MSQLEQYLLQGTRQYFNQLKQECLSVSRTDRQMDGLMFFSPLEHSATG